jgi:DNA ligase (NAD+)
MDITTIEQEYIELCMIVDHHNFLYHVKGEPEISDEEFDLLFRRLITLEENYPSIISENSPTQKVGYKDTNGEIPSIKISRKMQSLDNAFSADEVITWLTRLALANDIGECYFTLEYKLDGLAYEAVYRGGKLVHLCTRGDGETGKCIMRHLDTLISGIPRESKTASGKLDFEVHGEITCSKSSLIAINEDLRSIGGETFKTPRNTASALMRHKNSAKIPTKLRAYAYGYWNYLDPAEGFDYVPVYAKYKVKDILSRLTPTSGTSSAMPLLKDLEKMDSVRHEVNEPLDGMVIKLISSNPAIYEDVGVTNKAPRWAIAYTFNDLVYSSHVLSIDWQGGRTGVFTPVVNIEPINIGGVDIHRATFHNASIVNQFNVYKGDLIFIKRSGDVIPKIVDLKRSPHSSDKLELPEICPYCFTPLEWVNRTSITCPNPTCDVKLQKRIEHYVSTSGIDAKHIGPAVIDALLTTGEVNCPTDIHYLDKNDFEQVGIGPKLTEKILTSLDSALLSTDLPRFIGALGISGVGRSTARLVCNYAPSLPQLINLCNVNYGQDLLNISGIGPETAAALARYFRNGDNPELESLLNVLERKNVNPTYKAKIQTSSGDKLVCMTGSFPISKKQFAAELASQVGFTLVTNVTMKTDYVISDGTTTGKVERARKYNVPVYSSLEEFCKEFNIKL